MYKYQNGYKHILFIRIDDYPGLKILDACSHFHRTKEAAMKCKEHLHASDTINVIDGVERFRTPSTYEYGNVRIKDLLI